MKKMYLFAAVVIAAVTGTVCSLFLLVSCQHKENPSPNLAVETLKATKLEVDKALVGINTFIDRCDNLILLKDGNEHAFNLCELKGDSLLCTMGFGTVGDGPDAFRQPVAFFCGDLKGLVIKEVSNSKFRHYPAPLSETLRRNQFRDFTVEGAGNCFSGLLFSSVMMNDSTVLLVGGLPDTDNVFTLLSVREGISPLGGFPYPTQDESMDPAFRRLNYMSSMVLKQPGKNRYAWVGCEASYFSLLSIEHGEAVNIKHVLTDYPVCTQGETSLSHSPDDALGFIPCVTEKYIYLLHYSYKTRAEWLDVIRNNEGIGPDGYPQEYLGLLSVYDWDGNYIKEYKLDEPVRSFTVTADDKRILGQSIDLDTSEEKMVQYRMAF